MTRRSAASKQKRANLVSPKPTFEEKKPEVPVGYKSVTNHGLAHFISMLPLEGTEVSHSKLKARRFAHIKRCVELGIKLSPSEKFENDLWLFVRGWGEPPVIPEDVTVEDANVLRAKYGLPPLDDFPMPEAFVTESELASISGEDHAQQS